MKVFVRKHDMSQKARKLLVQSMKGEQIFLVTDLLKFYLAEGLFVTKVWDVIHYTPRKCFKDMLEGVADLRREADQNAENDLLFGIAASNAKDFSNCLYGSLLMAKHRHRDVKYEFSRHSAMCAINASRFRSMSQISDDFMKLKWLKGLSQCLVFGVFASQLSKLHMLKFYYHVLDRIIHRESFELITGDSDSLFIAISGDELDELVYPHMRDERAKIRDNWFLRKDPKWNKYDQRTLGLFKIEFASDIIVALASKTFCCKDKLKEVCKFGCKGVQK